MHTYFSLQQELCYIRPLRMLSPAMFQGGLTSHHLTQNSCHAGWGSAFMTKSLLEKPAVVVVSAKGPVVEAMERASEDVVVESGQVVRPRGLMRQASLNRALSR